MDNTTTHHRSPCRQCDDTGMLWDTVFYTFCGLLGPRHCACDVGKEKFRKWCQTKEVQQALHRKRESEIDAALKFSHLPVRWQDKTMENFEGHERLKIAINHYLDNFLPLHKQGRGLYLWSTGSGRGKTHLLSAICQQLMARYAIPCIFMTEEQIFGKIRETFHDTNGKEQERIRQFLEIDCLLLDDFGASKITPWKNEVLTAILDYRLNHALPTFFTSNYSPDEYRLAVAHAIPLSRPERIPSRIYEMCQGLIVEVRGEDWRKKLAFKK